MPKARNENSYEAEKLYKQGMKLVDIAKKLSEPEGTIRRWKSVYDWDGKNAGSTKKKQSERSDKEKKKKTSARKGGAPPGNKNAVGHGAPLGNKNSYKHGGYAAVFWDVLDEKEKEMIEGIVVDEETMLEEEIMLATVRERRIMEALNKLRGLEVNNKPIDLMTHSVIVNENKRKFIGATADEDERLYNEINNEKINAKEKLPGTAYSVTTTTVDKHDTIARLENELTRIQAQKTRCIEALNKLRHNNKNNDSHTGSDNQMTQIVKVYMPENNRDNGSDKDE